MRFFKPTLFLACTFLFVNTAMSQVSSISNDELVQYAKEQAYWVANVTCASGGKRVVQRKTDGDEWCAKEIEGYCDAAKEGAAEKACTNDYTSALTARESARQAQANAAREQARARQAEQQRQEQRRLADQRIAQQRAERERQAAEAAAAPLKKQINIEEELIKIEQEKLDLRRQELELQRRAVEIQALLDKEQ